MKIRWQIIIAVTLLIVLVFFVTTSVMATLKVEKPLVSILEGESNISEFIIQEDGDTTKIIISLKSFDSLLDFHKKLDSSLDQILKKDYTIIYNNEVPSLEHSSWSNYWRVNATLQELLISGNYTEAMVVFDELIGEDNYFLYIENNQLFFFFNLDSYTYFNVFKLERGDYRW